MKLIFTILPFTIFLTGCVATSNDYKPVEYKNSKGCGYEKIKSAEFTVKNYDLLDYIKNDVQALVDSHDEYRLQDKRDSLYHSIKVNNFKFLGDVEPTPEQRKHYTYGRETSIITAGYDVYSYKKDIALNKIVTSDCKLYYTKAPSFLYHHMAKADGTSLTSNDIKQIFKDTKYELKYLNNEKIRPYQDKFDSLATLKGTEVNNTRLISSAAKGVKPLIQISFTYESTDWGHATTVVDENKTRSKLSLGYTNADCSNSYSGNCTTTEVYYLDIPLEELNKIKKGRAYKIINRVFKLHQFQVDQMLSALKEY